MKISDSDLKKAIHPNETARFNLALLICFPAAIFGLIATVASFGLILIYVGLIALSVWFGLSIAKASLIANSVRVSKLNFPEVFSIYEEVRAQLGYEKDIPIYIIEEGTVNALIAKFFGTKFIVLYSELVKDMRGGSSVQMKWIIARFIGALKAKHFRLDFLRILIDSIEKIKIFNLFILPYERATQYTGDNIGLLICKDVFHAFRAFDKFMVGNDLSGDVNFQGILDQSKDVKGDFFAMLARITSTHPHQVDRYLNLLAFARKEFPEQFSNFTDHFDQSENMKLGYLLPEYK